MRATADDRSNNGGKNGRARDSDARVKPFRIDKTESGGKAAATKPDTKGASVAQDTKPATASSAKPIVRLKYEMCKNFRETGSCKYGDRCLFAHGDHELINRAPPPSTTVTVAPPASSADKKDDQVVTDSSKAD